MVIFASGDLAFSHNLVIAIVQRVHIECIAGEARVISLCSSDVCFRASKDSGSICNHFTVITFF